MLLGEPLFSAADLSDYLGRKRLAAKANIEGAQLPVGDASRDAAVIDLIIGKAQVEPLAVDFAKVVKHDPIPVRVRVQDFGRDTETDGVRVIRSAPFTGDHALFSLTPSSYGGSPRGRIERGELIIGLEGLADDPASLKQTLDREQEEIDRYLNWQKSQIEEHNTSIRPFVEGLMKARRENVEKVAALKDQL